MGVVNAWSQVKKYYIPVLHLIHQLIMETLKLWGVCERFNVTTKVWSEQKTSAADVKLSDCTCTLIRHLSLSRLTVCLFALWISYQILCLLNQRLQPPPLPISCHCPQLLTECVWEPFPLFSSIKTLAELLQKCSYSSSLIVAYRISQSPRSASEQFLTCFVPPTVLKDPTCSDPQVLRPGPDVAGLTSVHSNPKPYVTSQ